MVKNNNFFIINDYYIYIYPLNEDYKYTFLYNNNNYYLYIKNKSTKNENIKFKIMKNNLEYTYHILKESNNLIIKKNSFFMILPSCISIYKLLNLWKTPLINNKDGIEIVLNIMKRLIDIQLFLYNNYNIINLDIKTDNLMIEKKNKLIIDNIINIDLGLIKTKNNNTYQFDCKYMIWPSSENIKLEKIPSYSICINGLEILLGKEFIEKNKKMNLIDKLYFLKNNDEVYNIFYNGLLLKLNLKQLLVLILNYLKKNKNV